MGGGKEEGENGEPEREGEGRESKSDTFCTIITYTLLYLSFFSLSSHPLLLSSLLPLHLHHTHTHAHYISL